MLEVWLGTPQALPAPLVTWASLFSLRGQPWGLGEGAEMAWGGTEGRGRGVGIFGLDPPGEVRGARSPL